MTRFATILLIIGGLNWGLVGLFNYDLVAAIFGGQASLVARAIYTIVGLAALYEIFAFRNIGEHPVRRPMGRVETTPVDRSDRFGRAA